MYDHGHEYEYSETAPKREASSDEPQDTSFRDRYDVRHVHPTAHTPMQHLASVAFMHTFRHACAVQAIALQRSNVGSRVFKYDLVLTTNG